MSYSPCQAQASNQINTNLEGIVKTHIYPCPYEELVGSNCGFSRNPSQQHVKFSHPNEWLENNGNCEWIRLPVSCIQYQKATSMFNEIFFILWSMNADWLSFIVYHVGDKEVSSNYTYDFEIANYENNRHKISISNFSCHHYLQDVDEVLQFRNYVLLHKQSVRSVLGGLQNMCKIKIKSQQGDEQMEIEQNQLYNIDNIDYFPNILLDQMRLWGNTPHEQ
jgi:hypothetical protein